MIGLYLSEINPIIFEFNGWQIREKFSNQTQEKRFVIYHNCTFETKNVKFGFNYRKTRSFHYCVFCQASIPDEVTFLLEMIKK